MVFVVKEEDGVRELVRCVGLGVGYKGLGELLGVRGKTGGGFGYGGGGAGRCGGDGGELGEIWGRSGGDLDAEDVWPCLVGRSGAAEGRSWGDLGDRWIRNTKDTVSYTHMAMPTINPVQSQDSLLSLTNTA